MNRYLFTTIISFIFIISCNKKEEPIIYELFGQQIDTLIIGEPFTPTFFITLPPANVSFYLEGPLKDFKGIAGQFYFDNTSDSLYIHEDISIRFRPLRRMNIIKSIGRYLLLHGLLLYHRWKVIRCIALLFKVFGRKKGSLV